jgi:hypothetical protein
MGDARVRNGRLETMQILLEADANVDLRDGQVSHTLTYRRKDKSTRD